MANSKFVLTIIPILSLVGVQNSHQVPLPLLNVSDTSVGSEEQVGIAGVTEQVYESDARVEAESKPNNGKSDDSDDSEFEDGQGAEDDEDDFNYDHHLFPPIRALSSSADLWPGGKVYYRFPATFPKKQKDKIHNAMAAIQNATCIKFYPKTNKTEDFITFQLTEGGKADGDKGCSSQLGKVGGDQELLLSIDGCDDGTNYAGSAAHELMHALGFEHEFQRADREKYITFHRENVEGTDEEVEANYGAIPDGDALDIPFNFRSILQYDPRAGAKTSDDFVFTEKKPRDAGVVAPIGKFENMGQECKISAGDRGLINGIYQKECGLKKLTKFTKSVMIKGTDCQKKIQPMDDETF